MTRIKKLGLSSVAAVALLMSASGCGPGIVGVSSHTLATGPDTDVDVVWVRDGAGLMRCTQTAQGPACVRAQ